MPDQLIPDALTFVWPAGHSISTLLSVSRATKTGIILDLSAALHPEDFLKESEIDLLGVKLSWSQFNSTSIKEAVYNCRPQSLWIECSPDILKKNHETFFQALSLVNLSQTYLITANIELISSFFEKKIEDFYLVLKGNEAVGFSGAETTLSLFSFAESLAQKHNFYPQLSIWGGICTPEATATFLISGAQHIIFEHLHICTDEFSQKTDSQLLERLNTFRVEYTRLLPVCGSTHLRVYDKGNSQAVKNLLNYKNSLAGQDTQLSIYFKKIDNQLIPIYQSRLESNQLVGVGIETAFAHTFTSRFGSSASKAIRSFSREVAQNIQIAQTQPYSPKYSPLSKKLGCQYPFIQGAMACITDSPKFARSVAEAGGLPTIALGVKNIEQLQTDLGDLRETMGKLSYCINIITLPENPYRDEQLDWIRQTQPPFVVISAGSPLFAKELQQQGFKVIYVTSDQHLMHLAWDNAIQFVVCEGHEGGGHVGHHSTLTLAQTALELRRLDITLRDRPIILAGGIFNEASARRAFLLGAEGIQIGTAYLATQEIVNFKALHNVYQEMVIDSSFGDTTITGQSIGLQVRSLLSPKSRQIRAQEDNFMRSGKDENFIRGQLEKLSIGSLTIAAKGSFPGHKEMLSDDQCRTEGQYMCGSVAGVLNTVTSVSELHESLASSSSLMVLKDEKELLIPSTSHKKNRERIAITGMAISNSLGNSPEEVWQASCSLMSGITDIPPERWDHNQYFSELPHSPGKTYCSSGAFSSLDIDRKELGISPHDFRTMAHSTKLTLWLAHRAIADSGILEADFNRERIGVIIAQNSGESANTIGDLTITVKAAEIVQSIQQTLHLDPATTDALIAAVTRNRISTDDTTLLGRLSCTAGGFVCNKYNFKGASFAVTAACATGLVALYNAIQLIKNDILDVAVVGGGEEQLHPASYLEFSALGALGGKDRSIPAAQASRPFDSRRDGMILGEGGAMLVLERESSARKRQAKIHAFITGAGASNNNLGMIESVAETQYLAIKASFHDADYPSSEVDLVECHATATPTGDIEEVKALKAAYPQGSSTVLASFKSQIGHTLGTSGLNSLIRGTCAMNSKVFPPTINYDSTDPKIDLESWGFKVCKNPEKWAHNNTRPRRFQVNAFGFGGANYVIQVEQADWVSANDDTPQNLPTKFAMQQVPSPNFPGLDFYLTRFQNKSYRVGVADNKDTQSVASNLGKYLVHHSPGPAEKRALKRHGIFIEKESLPGTLALLFAGQGTHYKQMGLELYQNFPTINKWMKTIAGLADFDVLGVMFKDEDTDLRRTVWQQPALFVLEYSIYKQLEELGLSPTVLAGHSMGELTALAVAGVFGFEDAFRIISKRATCMEKASTMVDDPGAMLAVDVPENILDQYINADAELYYTNYNSPHQRVIGGSTAAILHLAGELNQQKFWNHTLAVSMAFHSPIMRVIRDELGDYLADIEFKPPQVPVVSNTTGETYPNDIDKIKEIIVAHLESPVLWQTNMTTIRDEFNIDYFLEIGPRDTLCKFLSDILPGADSLFTCYPEQEIKTFKSAIAALYCRGYVNAPGNPDHLNIKESSHAFERDREEIQKIIQQEINIYALQGIEKYLKPAILEKIHQKIDPAFTAADLSEYFGSTPQVTPPSPPVQSPVFISKEMVSAPEEKNSGNGSTVETLISIIMDATGYERSEIEPGMDIRQDLSIRSSRLPVIMDAAEKAFGITIKLEEFMGIQTIADFADQINKTISSQGVEKKKRTSPDISIGTNENRGNHFFPRLPIKRLIPRQKELPPISATLPELADNSHILIVSLGDTITVSETRDYLEHRFNADITTVILSIAPGENTIDPCDHTELQRVLSDLRKKSDLAGVIFLSGQGDSGVQPIQINQCITGLFLFIKQMLETDKRKFCLHLRLTEKETLTDALFAEGLLGFFLSARIEYQSMIFRSLLCRDLPDMYEILDICLDSGQSIIELELQGGTLHTLEYIQDKVPTGPYRINIFNKDSVILLTAGARGVTARLAKNISRFGPTLILLGRTSYQSDYNYDQSETELSNYIERAWPDRDKETQHRKLQDLKAGREIGRLITDLSKNGATVEYISCDITDVKQVEAATTQILDSHGKIDTLIHGAGIIIDGFVSLLSAEEFHKVIEVKLTGLINLIDAVGISNIHNIVGLSSLAAITGNIGQSNYCSANRLMSRYLRFINDNSEISAKVFWLPPIEGAGMIEDPDVKELVALKVGRQAFVDADEIAEIMVRELIVSSTEHCWVAPTRQLPQLNHVSIENVNNTDTDSWFDCSAYPMIDRLTDTDFKTNKILAERLLTQEHDLWLNDHKPFKWLKHPIISAIMIIETFIEMSLLHNPGFTVHKLKNIVFKRILECPPDTGARVSIESQTVLSGINKRNCRITLGKPEDKQSSLREGIKHAYFTGEVILGVTSLEKEIIAGNIPLSSHASAMNHDEILHYYQERSGLTGRYRILEKIVELTDTRITGTMVYPGIDDFASPVSGQTYYPHYLLEALMQLAGFYSGINNPGDNRVKVPSGIGQLAVFGECRQDEKIYLLAELVEEEADISSWNGRAVNSSGELLLSINQLAMRWLS